ncbi:MAG: Mrp/NBP35 family ATP-binding protein [Deltaproteobacteria bacterium]|nr:Mrp/NBP35 family ATP-binding protein [Deltaproteobacteria bacterium]MBW2070657.1 Mrp/NBP35 family ATP-binding protein [Deltaproteobacteria bacterium]
MKKEACDEQKPCDSCESGSSCSAKEKEAHEQKRLEQRLYHIRHKIMVMSGKGGVGKSTVATNLAASLAFRDYRVGILDADIHGPNVPKMLGVEERQLVGHDDGVDPVEVFKNFHVVSMGLLAHDPDRAIVWRGPLKHSAIKQFLADVSWGDLDFLFIDLPPGTGDEPLSVANLIKNVDGSIIVTTPQDVALLDSRKAVNFSRLLNIPVLGIVENMSGLICPHCGEKINLFKIGGGEQAARQLGVPFLGRIPIDPEVVEKCDCGEPFVAANHDSEAKKAYEKLTQEVIEAMESAGQKKSSAVH